MVGNVGWFQLDFYPSFYPSGVTLKVVYKVRLKTMLDPYFYLVVCIWSNATLCFCNIILPSRSPIVEVFPLNPLSSRRECSEEDTPAEDGALEYTGRGRGVRWGTGLEKIGIAGHMERNEWTVYLIPSQYSSSTRVQSGLSDIAVIRSTATFLMRWTMGEVNGKDVD